MINNLHINGYSIAPLFTGMVIFLIGVFVCGQNKNNKINRLFFYLCISVFIWTIGYSVMYATKNPRVAVMAARAGYFGVVFIPVFVFHFISEFLKLKTPKFIVASIYALGGLFFLFNFTDKFIDGVYTYFWGFYPTVGPWYKYYIIFFAAVFTWSVIVLFKNLRSNVRGKINIRTQNQIKYLLFAFMFAATSLVDYIQNYGIEIYPWGYISALGWIVFISIAIIRHQLMDIEVIIKKTLVFAGLFIMSYAVFASFVYLGSLLFENVIQSRWIALIPSVFIIVLILRPLENYLRNATDKYLFQKKYDYKHLLRTFSDEVLTVLDLDMLVNLTVNKLVQIIKLENAAILIYDEDNERYKMVASTGMDVLGYSLREEDPLIKFLSRGNKYILMDSFADQVDIYKDIKASASRLNSELIVPLSQQDDIVGILSLGKKKSDEEFTQDDVDIILPLARTLAVAITNAKLFEKLSEAQAQAAQREKMAVIGTLSAGINHEICNPLGIARGQCEMFLLNMKEGIYKDKSQEELLEKAQEIMNMVINETDRATVITRKLSSFAKPAKGNTADDVDIKEEIDQVVSLVEHDLKMDNILIKKEIEDALPLISADKKQVQEIFFNIIRNAAQSIKEGNGEIRVKAFNHDKAVHVDIEDTGEGISKTNLGKIFNPFFTTKDPGGGTGLGLFIVKQIVERNNGTISAKSELGRGTTFSLTFTSAEAA